MTSTCKKCENPTDCDCQCDLNSVPYITQNVLATMGGLGLTAGGLTLNISSNGLLAHVGNAMMGAGISTAYQGIEKTIKKKRYNGIVFCVDAAFGAANNTLTEGIYVAGDVLIIRIAQCTAREIVMFGKRHFTIGIITGAVSGITTKITSEIKGCVIREKKWSCFGKTLDQNGKENGTATSWIGNTVLGSFYGIFNIVVTGLLNCSCQIVPKWNICRYRSNKSTL